MMVRSARLLRLTLPLLAAMIPSQTSPVAEPTAPRPRSVSLSGIPYRPDDASAGPADVVDAIRARRAGGKLLNLDRMLLHSPPLAQGWNAMFGAIRTKLTLPPKLRELAILSVGFINRAEYEWRQHEPEFLAAGGTRAQLDALRDPATALGDSAHFDATELAALTLAYEMTTRVTVAEVTMRRVRALLPDAQVVELVGTIAGYNMVSRFVVATGVEME
ncbi:MAG TPA: carboxymuconolactone decarboxylase family protein [Anaeromyxobacteraceae bacterium]|nr:carboxymuconolactone decarboxylase family protein [Anaeromyxobacteraceae bacterium]